MIKHLTLLATLILSTSMTAVANDRYENNMFVFVGELLHIEELPRQCPQREEPYATESTDYAADLESICIQFDALFQATYQVVDVLYGDSTSQIVTFDVADHYGFPSFAYFKNALLFLNTPPEATWLEKYQGYAVHRTKSGSWATCGNPYDERRGDDPRHLIQQQFANDLGVVGEFSTVGLRRIYGDSPDIIIDGNRVRCVNGVRLMDFYEIVRTGVLAARSINLPKLSDTQNEL